MLSCDWLDICRHPARDFTCGELECLERPGVCLSARGSICPPRAGHEERTAEAARGQVMDLLRGAGRNLVERRDQTRYVELEEVTPSGGGAEEQLELRCGGRSRTSSRAAEPNSEAGGGEGGGEAENFPPRSSTQIFPPCVKKTEDRLELGERDARATTHADVSRGDEEFQDGGGYLSRRSESDDDEEGEDVSLVLSDDSGPRVTELESHYITTHEIQLAELSDHEGDSDLGAASSSASWDDHQAYSFVHYALESDGARERGDGGPPARAQGAAAVSSLLENDLCASKPQLQQQRDGSSGGQIHLSITTTSRAINDPSNIQEQENILHHAARAGDMSRCVFRGVDGKADTLRDRAKCHGAAPGRPHFGGKFRGKEVTGNSSGTSSAVSELDDADKEVRSLTARAFRSLAYPYLEAINFSTSSESSASERGVGINRWSTFVDLKYGNVNVAPGLDQSLVSCQNSLEIGKNIDTRGYKGVALAGIEPPTSSIFTLNGTPKKLQLMGPFARGPRGVIRLTETLNFRCNVKSEMSAGGRREKFADNAAGSRSRDEVPNSLLSSQSSAAPRKAMEDTHKKAVLASSLIKNVLSKKMQFEQERKMERGEISEPRRAPQESDAHRPVRRQSSSSDHAMMCVDEVGDIVDSGSCDAGSDSRGRGASAPAAGTNLEPREEGGGETKKNAMEASRSTLLRSQNSAFRCWKDEDLGFQPDHNTYQTLEERLLSARDQQTEGARCAGGKITKMSRLFVPSVQLLSGDAERHGGGASGTTPRCITESSSLAASRSPEIQINLRSVREPPAACTPRAPHALAAALRGESSEKVPHFTVRDVRDSKAKLQTPIHHVRDVRKLVKSSYHFVSLDSCDNRCSFTAESHEQKKQPRHASARSASPMVITCQSVNTNTVGRDPENCDFTQQEPLHADKSPPGGAKTAPPQGGAGLAPLAPPSTRPGGSLALPAESKTPAKKQEKASDLTEKKPEAKMSNQEALEKLQAAVKCMEQLYVFEKNEWKRKSEPRPLTDSHVLSLISSEEHGGPEDEGARVSTGEPLDRRDSDPNADQTSPAADSLLRWEDRDLLKASSGRHDRLAVGSTPTVRPTGSKTTPKTSPSADIRQQNGLVETPVSARNLVLQSPKLPVSLRIRQTRSHGGPEPDWSSAPTDNENYLTIPVRSHPSNSKAAPAVYASPAHSNPTDGSRVREDQNQTKRSSIVMETRSPDIPSAAFYHSLPLALPTPQSQVYCFSPAMTPAPPLDPFQTTQRKMLLDPTTGSYYLVDTPVQPATKRLFDPETGQYVDVPMPQPPMTPVPMSPLALSPGAYGHTYMIYPGFMPAPPVIPARTLLQSQASLDTESSEKVSSQHAEGMYMETPFYMATGKSSQASGAPQQIGAGRQPHAKQPVISITSQQGPRIIAPPSFDGTTMSFVVEHR